MRTEAALFRGLLKTHSIAIHREVFSSKTFGLSPQKIHPVMF